MTTYFVIGKMLGMPKLQHGERDRERLFFGVLGSSSGAGISYSDSDLGDLPLVVVPQVLKMGGRWQCANQAIVAAEPVILV